MSPFSALLRATIPSRNISRASSCQHKRDNLFSVWLWCNHFKMDVNRFTDFKRQVNYIIIIFITTIAIIIVIIIMGDIMRHILHGQVRRTKILESKVHQLTGDGMKASWYFLGFIRNCPWRENTQNLENCLIGLSRRPLLQQELLQYQVFCLGALNFKGR